ncbi:hypothetical protein HK101_006274 [Irineochytrium annulatum]|nr:hypothetical protein HK101_006274 [Irineochytrium annulatum]
MRGAERKHIRKESRSLLNRLKSIDLDASFVSSVADELAHYPLMANERCGTWYIDPKRAHEKTVYFKSTDGHFGKWDFNLRRMNRHLLEVVAEHGGCIIVDSTRHGKKVPDSLAKTVPIWCCVVNRVIAAAKGITDARPRTGNGLTAGEADDAGEVELPMSFFQRVSGENLAEGSVGEDETDEEEDEVANEDDEYLEDIDEAVPNHADGLDNDEDEVEPFKVEDIWDTDLHTLPSCVSLSEHTQMISRIPAFVERLQTARSISLPNLLKPLRPLWIHHPDTSQPPVIPPAWRDPTRLPFHPLFLVSASRPVPDGLDRRPGGFTYVQGSADDHETWAMGITPGLWWSWREMLTACATAEECEEVVRGLVGRDLPAPKVSPGRGTPFDWIGDTRIAIGTRAAGAPPACWETFDAVLNCGCEEHAGMREEADDAAGGGARRYMFLPIPEGKKGSAALAANVAQGVAFIRAVVEGGGTVLVHCMQGRDRSVCVALCYLIEEATRGTGRRVTKEVVRDRLLYIQGFRHVAQPCRANLRRVNSLFMGPDDGGLD